MTIDTCTVKRRRLCFKSLNDLHDDLAHIERASEQGTLVVKGNWTLGQILAHLAAWIEYGWDGYPVKPSPLFLRWILKFVLKRYLRFGLPTGLRIPGVKEGTTGQHDVPLEEGLARLRRCIERLKSGEPARFSSPAFGPMTEEDRIQFNLRHAELHLGFVMYE